MKVPNLTLSFIVKNAILKKYKQTSVYVVNTNLLQIVKLFSTVAAQGIALYDVTGCFYMVV